MEILFKDDEWFYLIENDTIDIRYIKHFHDIDLTNIQHLDDAKILYHYIDNTTDKRIAVYYEYNERYIGSSENIKYNWFHTKVYYTKDYTLVNLKLLEDGSNI